MKVQDLKGRSHNLILTNHLIDWNPKREVSKPQAAVKSFLRPYWERHIVTEECPLKTGKGRPMRSDLMNWTRRIAVEVSPSSSHKWNAFFHKSRHSFGAAVGRDLDKITWFEKNGFTLIELGDEDLADLTAKMFLEKHGVTL
jgi:hypothetical protein